MIVYHPCLNIDLLQFGIQIPVDVSRSQICFEKLQQKFPKLKPIKDKDVVPITREQLEFVHDKTYVDDLFHPDHAKERVIETFELFDAEGKYHRFDPSRGERPLKDMVPRVLEICGLSFLSMKKALKKDWVYCLGGGFHHAMSFGGRGFCLVNDVVLGLRLLKNEGLIQNAWVIDVDAHKGDGTAELTQGDRSLLTLSIHMKSGWPLEGPEKEASPSHIPSDIDIPIDMGEEESYLEKLEEGLKKLKAISSQRPDLVVIVNGADPYREDELPSTHLLNLSKGQLFERDMLVYHFLKSEGLPQCYLMGGGYGSKTWTIYYQFLERLLTK